MKYYLLIAGYYYPEHATGDWVSCYETREEALAQVSKVQIHSYFQKGPRKGQIKETRETYKIDDFKYDWYKVVDLRKWIS